jgi:hypothetical protein
MRGMNVITFEIALLLGVFVLALAALAVLLFEDQPRLFRKGVLHKRRITEDLDLGALKIDR